jgi:hypothetical protein
MADDDLYGLLAEFDDAQTLVGAAKKARDEGYRRLDAFTPFPVEGLAEALELHDRRVLWIGLIGAIVGAVIGFGIQAYTNFDYPINVGGRPLYPISAFTMVGLWITILGATLFAAIGMLALNHLPKLNHPVFAGSRFHLASKDKFFLWVMAQDPHFEPRATARLLLDLGAQSVEAIRR